MAISFTPLQKVERSNLNKVWNSELRLMTSNFELGVKEWPFLHVLKCEVIWLEGSIYSRTSKVMSLKMK